MAFGLRNETLVFLRASGLGQKVEAIAANRWGVQQRPAIGDKAVRRRIVKERKRCREKGQGETWQSLATHILLGNHTAAMLTRPQSFTRSELFIERN